MDAQAGERLVSAATKGGVEILVAPTVLYEALRTPDEGLRERLAKELTRPRWTRLMTEVYSASMELLGEVQRLRPGWLRSRPDLARFRQFRSDWTKAKGGFWDRARTSTAQEWASLVQLGDPEVLRQAREQAGARREEMKGREKWEHAPLPDLKVMPPGPRPGWRGDPVEPWRWDGLTEVSSALMQPRHAYRDWLEPYLDEQKVMADGPAWGAFWLYEVEAANMPRFWTRWAVEYLQRFKKVTAGTPADGQLATHLVEADVLLTEDKGLVDVIERARPFAPRSWGAAQVLRGNDVKGLLELVAARGFDRGLERG